ncbi:MAG TPA: hypothetical protein VGQ83_35645 [Polyangia bacterium]|jgi:hypothetical protein
MPRAALVVIVTLLGLGAAREAAAQPLPEPELAARHHDVRVNFGAFSAVGFAGFTYAYSPAPRIQLELGVGYGLTGVQVSAMPKLSFGTDAHRFVVGLGVAGASDRGAYESTWLNVEAGYELRSRAGFSFLVAGGLTAGLGGRVRPICLIECRDEPAAATAGDPARGWVFPQVRVAVGQWF